MQAAAMVNHASTKTTQLYDHRRDAVSLDEVERISIWLMAVIESKNAWTTAWHKAAPGRFRNPLAGLYLDEVATISN